MAEEHDEKSLELRITRLENAITKLAERCKPVEISADEIKAYLKVGGVLGRGGIPWPLTSERAPGFTTPAASLTYFGPGFTTLAGPVYFLNPGLNPLHGGTTPVVSPGYFASGGAEKFGDLGSK